MKLKNLAVMAAALLVFTNCSYAASKIAVAETEYWGIKPVASVFDSLKVGAKKPDLPDNTEAFKAYVNALQFRELLEASDGPIPALPTSASILNGSQIVDTLNADEQLIYLYRNLGDQKAEAALLSSLGTRAAVSGDMEKAVAYFLEALEINTEVNNTAGMVKNYFSLARIHGFQGQLDEAARYNQMIVQIALSTRNNRHLSEAYMNLANLWSAQKKFRDAEAMIMNKALPLNYYKLQDKVATMKCYDQLAEIYQAQKRFSEAKWFFIQSNMVARKINNQPGIINSLINLAHVKMSIGDPQLALSDFREAEKLSLSNKYNYKIVEIKGDLSKVYTLLGDKNAADIAMNEFTALKDAFLKTGQ